MRSTQPLTNLPSLSSQQVTTPNFCEPLVLSTVRIAQGVRSPSSFLAATAANLHLCFQQLPRCSSRNPFPFKLLHCCPGVAPPSVHFNPHLNSRYAPSGIATRRDSSLSPKSPVTNHQSLTPVFATDPRNRLLSPLLATLPKSPFVSPLFATHPHPPPPSPSPHLCPRDSDPCSGSSLLLSFLQLIT